MNEEQKKHYETMTNLELVEKLMAQQDIVTNLIEQRNQCKNDGVLWHYFHDILYKEQSLLIDIKYMVVKRMGGCI